MSIYPLEGNVFGGILTAERGNNKSFENSLHVFAQDCKAAFLKESIFIMFRVKKPREIILKSQWCCCT